LRQATPAKNALNRFIGFATEVKQFYDARVDILVFIPILKSEKY